jgi:hypothetical protein
VQRNKTRGSLDMTSELPTDRARNNQQPIQQQQS